MKKEVLLSLLMTTPVAFPALALDLSNLTTPGTGGVNWTPESNGFVSGYGADGEGMICPPGIKSISRVLSLPAGTYSISLDANAQNCVLSVNDGISDPNVEVIVSRRKVTGFVVKSGTDTKVTVKIVPENPNKNNDGTVKEEKFSFSKLNLDLDFDWAKATADITTAYNNAKFGDIKDVTTSLEHNGSTVNNTSDKVVELGNAKSALDGKIAALDKDIVAVKTQSLDNYKKFELYKENNKILVSIAALKAEADSYNADVKAENTRFENYAVNSVEKNDQLQKQLAYVKKVQTLNEQIAAILADKNDSRYDYVVSENYKKRGEDLAALLAPYKELIESTYTEDKLESKIDTKALKSAWSAIENEYYLLDGRINGASDDLKAYDEFYKATEGGDPNGSDLFLALRKSYQELVISLAEDQNVDEAGKPLPYPANAFAEKITEINNTFEPLYRAAAEYVDVKQNEAGLDYATLLEIGGSADKGDVKGNKTKAIEAINEAQQAVTVAAEAWNNFVTDQKAAMKTAYDQIKTSTDAANNTAKAINVPSQLQGEVDTAKDKVLAEISKMKSAIDAAYGKDLSEDTYKSYIAASGAVSKAQDALVVLQGKATQITAQHSRLTAIKDQIKGISFLEGLYAGDIKVIEDAFAALTKIDDKKTEEAVKDGGSIDKLLTNLETASEGLIDAYKAADVKADYDKLTKYIDSEKHLLPGAEGVRTTTYNNIKELTKAVNKIDGDLQAVIANHEDGKIMQTYAAIKQIGDNAGDTKAQIAAERQSFTVNASKANLKVVNDKLASLKSEIEAAKVQGNDKDKDAKTAIATLEGKLTELAGKINATTVKEKDFNGYDKTLQSYLDGNDSKVTPNIPAIEKIVESTLANYRAYKAMTAELAILATQLGNIADINEQLSKDPAKAYYAGVIGDASKQDGGHWKTYKGYNNEIEQAYNAEAVKDNAAALNKDGKYVANIKTTIEAVKGMAAEIRANETAHDEQLAAADRVNKLLQAVQEELNDANTAGGNGTFTPAEISKKVKEISEAMLALNRQVTEAYGKGESTSLTIIPNFGAQEAEAQALLNAFSDTYSAAIAEENSKRLADKQYADGTSSWNQISAALTAEYDNSIDSYIKHAYQLTNAGYKKYIADNGGIKTDINELYDLQPEIADKKNVVEDPVKGILAKANKDGKLLTQTALADAVADANTLLANIKNVGKAANDEADRFANGYWNIINPKFQTNIDNHDALTAAGIVDKYISVKKPNDTKVISVATDEMAAEDAAVLAAKKKAYKLDDKGNPTNVQVEHLGQVMDDIANELDKVVALDDARKEAIAKKMWNASYTKTVDELSKRIKELDTLTAAAADDRTAAKETMNEVVGKISELNDAVADLESVFAGINAKIGADTDDATKTTLAGYYAKAMAAYNVVKAAHDKATATAKLFDEYTKLLDAAKADFEALSNFGETLAGTYGTLNSIENQIETIQAQIDAKNYVSDDNNIKDNIKTLKDTTIPVAYKTVVEDGLGELTKQSVVLESAWAEASKTEYNVAPATLQAYRDKIDTFKASALIAKFNPMIEDVNYDYETVAEKTVAYKAIGEELREVETSMSQLEEELRQLCSKSAVDAAKAELTEAYNKVAADINSLSTYEQETQDAFAAKFAELKADLDEISGDWAAAGVNVVMQKDNFEQRIADVAAEVKAELGKVAVKDAAVKAHKAAYADLSAKYDAQVEILNDIKNLIDVNDIFFAEEQRMDAQNNPVFDEAGNPVMYKPAKEKFEAEIEKLEARLANSKKDLDKQNVAGNMDKNSVLLGFNTPEKYNDPNKTDETVTIPATIANLRNATTDGALGVIYTLAGSNGNSNVVAVMKNQLLALYKTIDKANILPDVKANLLADYDVLAEKASKAIDKVQLVQADGETTEKLAARKLAQAEKNINAGRSIIEEAQALVAEGEKNTFMRGDVNLDKECDVADLQTVVTLVGERTSYDEFVAANGENGRVMAAAADMNDDQAFTTSDISAVISTILDPKNIKSTPVRVAMSRGAVEGSNVIAASFVSEEAGVRRYAVNVDNSAAFVAGQFDIALGEGMTLVDVVAADRAAAHEVALFHHGADSKRVVLYNMDNAVIEGQNGAVVYIDVIGDGTVEIENAIFADRNSIDYSLNGSNNGTSGIEDTVIDNNGGLKQRIYNAAGQALRGLQRGVNIIRNADGSVSKEYHK